MSAIYYSYYAGLYDSNYLLLAYRIQQFPILASVVLHKSIRKNQFFSIVKLILLIITYSNLLMMDLGRCTLFAQVSHNQTNFTHFSKLSLLAIAPKI